MAMSVNAILENGMAVTNGYFKITSVRVDTMRNMVHTVGTLWANKDMRDDNKQPISMAYYIHNFVSEDNTGNIIKEAYDKIAEETKDVNSKAYKLLGAVEEV